MEPAQPHPPGRQVRDRVGARLSMVSVEVQAGRGRPVAPRALASTQTPGTRSVFELLLFSLSFFHRFILLLVSSRDVRPNVLSHKI